MTVETKYMYNIIKLHSLTKSNSSSLLDLHSDLNHVHVSVGNLLVQ